MKSEQMKRIGMFANARFDGETVPDPENVQDPVPVNPEPESPIDNLLGEGVSGNLAVMPMPVPETPEEPGDGAFELVKEKPAKPACGWRRFVRPALIVVAVFVAYKLFFAKRR